MIIRILGDGQYDLGDSLSDEFTRLDNHLVAHVDEGNEEAYHADLAALIDLVRTSGRELPEDEFAPSDLVLPNPNASLDEIRALLSEESQA